MLIASERQLVLRALHAFLQPQTASIIINVHELDADGAAVGVAQPFDDFAQRQEAVRFHRRAGKLPVQVRIGQAVISRIEFGWRCLGLPQRVHLRDDVAARAVAADQRSPHFPANPPRRGPRAGDHARAWTLGGLKTL